jgi:hypothetical protein
VFGFAVRVNVGPFTVRFTVVVCVMLPDTPVMVIVEVPEVALAPAVRVSVLVEAVETGLNFAVTPVGIPEALKLTLSVNPSAGTTVMVLVPGLPCAIVSVFGSAVRLKLGPAEQLLKANDAMFVDQSKVPYTA